MFAPVTLSLYDDPILNVRLRLANSLPLLYSACHEMPEYKTAVDALTNDEDADVRAAMVNMEVCKSSQLEHSDSEDREKKANEDALYSKAVPLDALAGASAQQHSKGIRAAKGSNSCR